MFLEPDPFFISSDTPLVQVDLLFLIFPKWFIQSILHKIASECFPKVNPAHINALFKTS